MKRSDLAARRGFPLTTDSVITNSWTTRDKGASDEGTSPGAGRAVRPVGRLGGPGDHPAQARRQVPQELPGAQGGGAVLGARLHVQAGSAERHEEGPAEPRAHDAGRDDPGRGRRGPGRSVRLGHAEDPGADVPVQQHRRRALPGRRSAEGAVRRSLADRHHDRLLQGDLVRDLHRDRHRLAVAGPAEDGHILRGRRQLQRHLWNLQGRRLPEGHAGRERRVRGLRPVRQRRARRRAELR